ncbi:MAG: hypothetical protein QOI98_712 [Solirubrobacteraceae bacterium]|jgi:diguanylate cyclase (GGDEF)-like protein|nr:hypothetical protein [Solirubrobacteraceae bacterium]
MEALRSRRALAIVAVAALIVVGIAYTLLQGQRHAENSLKQGFAERAAFAARVSSSVLKDSGQDYRDAAAATLSGPRGGLGDALRASAVSGQARIAVLDSRGRRLTSVPAATPGEPTVERRARAAAATGRVAVSDIFHAGGVPVVRVDVPYRTAGGRRVVSHTVPLRQVARVITRFLPSAPGVRGAHAYLLDRRGLVIAASTHDTPARSVRDEGLRAALARSPAGRFGGTRYVAKPVGATNWQIVFSAPERALLAPAHGSGQRSLWLSFAALLAMLLGLLAMAFRAVRHTAALSHAREREATAVERELAAEQLARERLHDGLTGLPNRALFLDRAEHALSGVTRRGRPLVMMFVDVDRFKRVNDSLGHELGDETIREIGRRLHRTVRPMDTVSRFGGDEFVVMCDVDGDESEARAIARRIQEALEQPIGLGERKLQITASIGIALQRPDDRPTDPASLIRDADAAMYRAKQGGGAAIEVFQPEFHEVAIERLEMELALRNAVENGELRLHYQPIVSLADGRARGAEALVRWERPGHGLVSPLEFIPLAESTGMIIPIGEWVLEHGLRELSRWKEVGWLDDDFELTVNLSPRQVADPGLRDSVADILVRTGTRPATLCLEITESMVMDDLERAVDTLHSLKRVGVKLALDDFGVGHSSLGQVARLLPVDLLKVDRSFVGAIDEPRDRAVLQNIATLASSLDLLAVAEGIETPEQAHAVAEMGYPLAQGYLFAKPVPGDQLRGVVEQLGAVAA